MVMEKTIARPVSFEGVGLQTGERARVTLKPLEPGAGIRFTQESGGRAREEIVASPSFLADGIDRRSVLAIKGFAVETVEHLMAALYALGISNLLVEIEGGELPGFDGSAREFVRILREAGIITQDRPSETFGVPHPLFCSDTEASLAVFPGERLRVSYTFHDPRGRYRTEIFAGVINKEFFVNEIAGARTFCLESEAEGLRSRGYGKGATYENTLVIGQDGRPVKNRFRFHNECARHKVLDLLGDLGLLGFRLEGHVIGIRSGHRLNHNLVRLLHEMKSGENDRA